MENNNRQGCRWTKASEPPKERTKNLIVRCQNKAGNVYNYVATYDPEKIYAGGNWDCDNVIEWLDESPIEPCATSSENYWKQRCEAAEKVLNTFPSSVLEDQAGEDYLEYEKLLK